MISNTTNGLLRIKLSFFLRTWKMFLLLNLIVLQVNAQTFPAGFSQVKIGTIYYPTSMAFAPDGRIFCTEKSGKVKVVKNGKVLSTPFLQVSVNQLNERGLSSVVVDPDFSNNHYVYIYYTTASSPIHNRLSRFTANGDVAVAGSEFVLHDFETQVNSIHNGGGMAFGADGKLYLAIGNDNVNSYSQDLNSYKGKVLRINTDFSVPPGNPFTGSEPAKRIWAYGFRNPWTVAIQPGTNKLFVNDVGEGTWEEINNATVGGKNFGWPNAEGMSTNPAYTNPIYTYHHGATGTDNGCSITGGAFFNSSSSNYPSQYTGKYFFIDYCNQWINYLDLSNGVQKYNFATNLAFALNYIKVGTDGNIYYFSISQDALYKIIYTNNNAPVVTTQPVNVSVPQGQPATFSVSASGATPLNYQWRKNGVNISGANASSYTINNVQSTNAGQYSVVVSNSFGSDISNSATLTVTAFNAKPVATIITPTVGTFYRDGNVINFSGTGTDQEDGILPASAFSWIVEFHHAMHIHPGPFISPGIKNGSFIASFGAEAAANVYFRLILYVTDSQGLKDTAFVDIHPVTSTLSLASQPSGLQLLLEGLPHTTPYSVLAISGMTRTLGVISPQVLNGVNYVFDHWVHGGAVTQNITISDNDTSFTAIFKINTNPTCSASGTISREIWTNISGYTIASIPVNTTPVATTQLTIFEGPSNVDNNYGSRIRGYICPPLTGNYIFWIASDNNSQLWLSTNDNPANKVKIASVSGWTQIREWTKYLTQQSSPINLVAGQKYYIEALHKEVDKGDNLAVGWQLPNGNFERPILGSRLSPFEASSTSSCIATITPSSSLTFCSGSVVLNANTGTGFLYQWKKDGVAISGATAASYTATTTGDYQLKITQGTCVAWSAPLKVMVNTTLTAKITAGGALTFCSGGSVKLYANTCSGYTYQWKRNGIDIPGATTSTYTATLSGNYQIKIVQGSSVAWSALTTITVTSCKTEDSLSIRDTLSTDSLIAGETEIKNYGEPLQLKVYPNPTNGQFSLEMISMNELTNERFIIEVTDALGQLVYLSEPAVVNGNIKKAIELDKELPIGIYFLKVTIGNKEESTRVMLTK